MSWKDSLLTFAVNVDLKVKEISFIGRKQFKTLYANYVHGMRTQSGLLVNCTLLYTYTRWLLVNFVVCERIPPFVKYGGTWEKWSLLP